jgi:hypothetical protein
MDPACTWLAELPKRLGPWILDLTHNPYPMTGLEIPSQITVLTNDFNYHYQPRANTRFFPLFLWMYSSRLPLFFDSVVFDCKGKKRRDMMCLNFITRDHRTRLRQLLDPVADRMAYSMDQSRLPGETQQFNDVGIGHPVYARYAVNIVTETAVDHPYVSEKTCKPFMAKQIPIIVGSARINSCLADLGLDMFADLVPWQQWDDIEDTDQRLCALADFIRHWLDSSTVQRDYARVFHRVERNKRYFHSENFRKTLLQHMPPEITP